MRRYVFLLLLGVTLSGLGRQAAAQHPQDVPQPVIERLRKALEGARLVHLETDALKYELVKKNEKNFYQVTAGPYYFLIHETGDYAERHLALSEDMPDEALKAMRRTTLEALDESDMVIFAPPDHHSTQMVVTIFTDVTCPFSAALHRDIDFFVNEGVKIRYLAFPRQGPHSLGHKKMAPIWCNADRRQAFNNAIEGKRIRLLQCNDPVEDQFWLGEALGIPGTPTMLYENGEMSAGYDGSPMTFLEQLEKRKTP